MAEVVDSIIAELDVRLGNYVTNFDAASAAHKRFTDSVPKIAALGISAQEAEQYANRHRTAANDVAQAEEQATDKVVRSRKRRSEAMKQSDTADIASAKASADKRVETEEQAQARIAAAVERGEARRRAALAPAVSSRIGATVPREATGQRGIPAGVLGSDASAEVAAEAEIDRLKVDQITSQAALNTLKGAERREVQDNIAAMRLERQLRAENVSEEEILLRLESLRGAQAARNALEAKATRGNGAKNAEQFARGAGFYQATGGAFAVAGIAATAVVGGVTAAAKEGLDYANDLKTVSEQLTLTTKDLQIYQSAAERVGVKTEQLRTAFSDLANNIGRAKEGADSQSKIFGKDGLNIDLTKKGYETLSGILPTIVDRFTAIRDPAKRAALETALFGETGRKLDGLLSGGNASIKALGDELERTGGILSGEDIQRSAKVARDLKLLGDQLERQLASTVSQNAAAIESLATSLLKGAQALLTFIGAFQRFRAQAQIASGDPGSAAAGRETLNQTPEGRAQAFRNNSETLRLLRQGARSSDAVINVGAGQGTGGFGNAYIPNTPEARAALKKTLLAQRRETLAANGAADALDASTAQPVQPGTPGNLNVFAPKGRKGPDLAKQAEEREKRFQDELAQIEAQRLAAKREQLVGDQAQLEADQAALQAARDKKVSDINAQVKLKQLDAARAKELIAAEDAALAEQQRALSLKAKIRRENDDFQIDQEALAANARRTDAERQLATTTDQRRRLALQAFHIEQDREQAQLEHTRDSIDPSITDGDRARASARLKELPEERRQGEAIINQQNAHPLDAYKQRLHEATDSTRDAIENVEVNALGKLEDQLANSLTKVLGLKGAFGDLFGSILADLAKIEIEKGLLGVLGGGKGASSGGGLGGLLGSIGGLFGGGGASAGISAGIDSSLGGTLDAISALPGFASGGSATIGGNPGIDQNVLSINGKPSLRVGSGEQLTITPNNRRVAPAGRGDTIVHQTLHIDASNSVNPDGFEQRILSQANGFAIKAASTAGQRAAEASPAVVKRVQTLGS